METNTQTPSTGFNDNDKLVEIVSAAITPPPGSR